MPDTPQRRAEDTSTLAKVNAKVGEYRVFIYVIVGILIALGFKYTTPGTRMERMEIRQLVFQKAVDSLNKITTQQAGDMRSLKLLQCLNKNYTFSQLRLVDIICPVEFH